MGNEQQKSYIQGQVEKYASCCSKREEASKEELMIKDFIKNKQHGKLRTQTDQLDDHFTDQDDVESISIQDLENLDRFCQFDKRFPFYKMDVNGFIEEINLALIESKSKGSEQRLIFSEKITLSILLKGFRKFDSWSQLNDISSELTNFLKLTCPLNVDQNQDLLEFSVFKLKCVGILLCDGSAQERAIELFNLVQPAVGQNDIAFTDKELKRAVEFLTSFATQLTFRIEPSFTKKPRPQELSDNQLELIKADFDFETFYESEFIDLLFGAENLLKKEEFVKEVQDKTPWVLSPNQIRKKLFGHVRKFKDNHYEIDRAMAQIKQDRRILITQDKGVLIKQAQGSRKFLVK